MIWESAYWKEDLLRHARYLAGRTRQRRWSERSSARLEKTVMLGFYSIRKLFESQKISTEIVQRPISLTAYRWHHSPVTRINWHRFDEKYDLNRPRKITRRLGFICDQLIHSYVFALATHGEGGVASILFNSDRTRHMFLLDLPLETVVNLFNEIGNDYPSASHSVFDPAVGDFKTWLGPAQLPPGFPLQSNPN